MPTKVRVRQCIIHKTLTTKYDNTYYIIAKDEIRNPSETFQRLTVDGCAKVEEEVARRDGGDGAPAALEDIIYRI